MLVCLCVWGVIHSHFFSEKRVWAESSLFGYESRGKISEFLPYFTRYYRTQNVKWNSLSHKERKVEMTASHRASEAF
jgi:hypothetical protein